jgi:hypothetical protein
MKVTRYGRKVQNRAVCTRLLLVLLSATLGSLFAVLLLGITLHSSDFPVNHHASLTVHDNSRTANQLHHLQMEIGTTRARTIVAYAVSISSCGATSLSDGAAVLKHSIHKATQQSENYDYRMYAFVHPSAESCGRQLANLGYEIVVRDILVPVDDIQGEYLKSRITENGCCGEKELIKLEAFTLTNHPLVVHLDLDTILLKPLDNLFDFMLGKPTNRSNVGIMWPYQKRPVPNYIEATFTRDYNIVAPNRRYKPIQGGLLVFRPSLETYQDFQQILRQGDFRNGTGWGGVVGPFYGAMTIQGILPYYYDYLKGGNKSVELNRCVYNNMADNPRNKKTINNVVHGKCKTGQRDCEDCRTRPPKDVVNFHFTCCMKPWWCLQMVGDGNMCLYPP